jgi:hypothetical protein
LLTVVEKLTPKMGEKIWKIWGTLSGKKRLFFCAFFPGVVFAKSGLKTSRLNFSETHFGQF